ncbi:MAG: type IV pilus modification protein PilV [Gammaproteobacteria bacterium]|nr:type IV pilus modification protein PilV [Gammaproteobacteria bacterium]
MRPLSFHCPVSSAGQSGFGMLEVLISILVLAIGLLGLAALQTVGLKYNYQSFQRTQAVILTYELTDKIRANDGIAGNYQVQYGVSLGQPAAGTCHTSPCTAAQLAAYDLALWKQSINEQLGADADGQISYDPATLLHKIQIKWKENEADQEFAQEVEL